MSILNTLVGPITKLLDKLIPDKGAREAAQLELLRLQATHELDTIAVQMEAIIAEAKSRDPWTSRARPSFMYVMYTLMLFAIPMGIISAFDAEAADAIAGGMTRYLAALPEELYALFGTGYLGYTAARTWGKAKGVDR